MKSNITHLVAPTAVAGAQPKVPVIAPEVVVDLFHRSHQNRSEAVANPALQSTGTLSASEVWSALYRRNKRPLASNLLHFPNRCRER